MEQVGYPTAVWQQYAKFAGTNAEEVDDEARQRRDRAVAHWGVAIGAGIAVVCMAYFFSVWMSYYSDASVMYDFAVTVIEGDCSRPMSNPDVQVLNQQSCMHHKRIAHQWLFVTALTNVGADAFAIVYNFLMAVLYSPLTIFFLVVAGVMFGRHVYKSVHRVAAVAPASVAVGDPAAV